MIAGIVRRPFAVLAAAVVVGVAGGSLAVRLDVSTDISELLPPDHPSVQALDRLRREIGGESTAAVIVESPDREANLAFAEALIPPLLELRGEGHGEPYFSRVDFRKDTGFLEDNALYLATDEELDRVERYLRDRIEEARLEVHPFVIDLMDEGGPDEGGEPTSGDAMEAELRDLRRRVIPREYPVSDDGGTVVLRAYVTGSQTDVAFVESAFRDVRTLVGRLEPRSFHPEMRVEIGGRLSRHLMEIRAITGDAWRSFGSGVTAVLLLVVGFFLYKSVQARSRRRADRRTWLEELLRSPVTVLVLGLPLAVSLLATFGVAWLVYGRLNLMTSTLGLVLFGIGIDDGIHFYARYTEVRGGGRSVQGAAEATFRATGAAIVATSLTTAAALSVLLMADFRGFSEFGTIATVGVLAAMAATLTVTPALLVVLERSGLLRLESPAGRAAPASPPRRFPAPRAILLVCLVLVAISVAWMPGVEFEYELGRLEPDYPEYDRLRGKVYRVYPPGGRNPAYILVDDRDGVPEVVEALRRRAAEDTETPTIGAIETLQERFPIDPGAQRAKLERIAEIRELLGSRYLADAAADGLAPLVRAAQTRRPIPFGAMPEYLRRRFTSRSGDVGAFVMVYPSVGLSDGRMSMRFADDVGEIETADGGVYRAASTPIVAASMLRMMLRETPYMVGLTAAVIVLLMLATFRSARWAVLALLPLALGVSLMFGVMAAFGMKLNFYNLAVLPAVLGIGNDCGIHVIHRYRREGPGSVCKVVRSTGEHASVGALTTMIGFAGLALSFHPGLRSIGILAIVGIGATILATLLALPALLQWLEGVAPGEGRNGP